MHPAQLAGGVDSAEPAIEEDTCGTGFRAVHKVQRGDGVVEDGVDQDLEVRETQGFSDFFFDEDGESGTDDRFESLCERTNISDEEERSVE